MTDETERARPFRREEMQVILNAAEDGQLDCSPDAPAFRDLLTLARLGLALMEPDEAMVERVARAIWEAHKIPDVYGMITQRDAEILARAALAAMRG